MTLYLLALLLGVIAGFRAISAPAMVSWAAYFGWLDLSATWLAFLGNAWTRGILTLLALVELVTDQLPSTPSRTGPVQFGARVAAGALSGAAVGASGGAMIGGLLAGIIGAIIGTLGGRAFRARLATAFASDRPAAFIEDAVAIVASKGLPPNSVYSATKAAVRSFARTWTTDLKDRRIRVNAVSPGPIETPGLNDLVASSGAGEQRLKMLSNSVPLGRLGAPNEIAKAVVFLASDDSSYITGTELFVDGGMAQV